MSQSPKDTHPEATPEVGRWLPRAGVGGWGQNEISAATDIRVSILQDEKVLETCSTTV